MKYGITKKDLQIFNNKHSIQRQYLENKYFIGSTGQVKSLLDVSFSANHSKRYYSEIINKINTINDIINTELTEYSSLFITITLDGFYRDFLRGEFSRYNEVKHSKQVPNNDRFGHLKDKIAKEEKFTIKNLYNVLNFQVNRFQKSYIFKKIKKDGHKVHYIRVAEPHKKDGVPHIHMMMYIPTEYKEELLEVYKSYFPAPQNVKPLKNCEAGQLNGFQWEIKNAPAYILKYLFKSFLDVENQNELDELQCWYIKHRILRCITSHSLIPAWVYRKMTPLEQDWHYLTDIKTTGSCEWSKDDDFFKFEDEQNRVLKYEKGIYQLYKNDRLIKEFGTLKEQQTKINTKIKLTYTNKKDPFIVLQGMKFKRVEQNKLEVIRSNPIIDIDGVEYREVNGQLKETIKVPARMTDTQLYRYYLDIKDKNHDIHFNLVHNTCIDRGLIDSQKLSLNKGA